MSGILRIRQLLLINDPGLDTAGFGAYRSGLPGAFGPAAPRFLIPPDGIVAAVAFVPVTLPSKFLFSIFLIVSAISETVVSMADRVHSKVMSGSPFWQLV